MTKLGRQCAYVIVTWILATPPRQAIGIKLEEMVIWAPFSPSVLIRPSPPTLLPHPFPRALRLHPLCIPFHTSNLSPNIPTMLTTQSPSTPPRIHSHYSELPPNSRRAANLPFFAPRALPASSSSPFSAPNNGNTSGGPPSRRHFIPRRNAISYHPSQALSENPLINLNLGQGQGRSDPISEPASPRPSPAVLVMSESLPMSSSPPLVVTLAPARVPRSQRDYQAKMVANLLLTRAGRARPMRCARRTSFLRAGYQPSGLSASVLVSETDEEKETNFEEDELA